MTSGPILVGVISGPKAIETWRTMMGQLVQKEALPGTIRGDFAKRLVKIRLSKCCPWFRIQKEESAKREIALWFKEK